MHLFPWLFTYTKEQILAGDVHLQENPCLTLVLCNFFYWCCLDDHTSVNFNKVRYTVATVMTAEELVEWF